ncbi:RNA-binding motif protein, X-linked 2 [Echinops telfairi]|uniref:RNA-binding motif protein, X-linked 2 n=1 Tax=Echinops telfairi TaxID=9371 RepID=A0ABM0J733_ECHTE|nr:RNA-binding motif protein, X-linked 2 [Echinops telfairi]
MNPLTKVKLINELNERKVQLAVAGAVSWRSEDKDSAWIFLGGLPYELTEGDVICVFSQYGEVVNINLVRDKKTGKSKGFGFLCYEDQRSTILAVDNFNGIKIKGRTIRVDHVTNYRAPKDSEELDEVTKALQEKGCGAHTPPPSSSEGSDNDRPTKKHRKDKKGKKKGTKVKEKPEREVLTEPLPSSSSPSIKVITEEPGLKKHCSESSTRAPTAEAREGRKQQPSSPDGRRAADPERKEKPRIEPKSSSKREGKEDKSRDRDRGQGRSTDTHPGWPSSHRSRSRDQVYRHKRSWHSQGGEGSIPGATDPRPAQPRRRL